jgi:hypothetical protein
LAGALAVPPCEQAAKSAMTGIHWQCRFIAAP